MPKAWNIYPRKTEKFLVCINIKSYLLLLKEVQNCLYQGQSLIQQMLSHNDYRNSILHGFFVFFTKAVLYFDDLAVLEVILRKYLLSSSQIKINKLSNTRTSPVNVHSISWEQNTCLSIGQENQILRFEILPIQ